jgi:hypothetical protein
MLQNKIFNHTNSNKFPWFYTFLQFILCILVFHGLLEGCSTFMIFIMIKIQQRSNQTKRILLTCSNCNVLICYAYYIWCNLPLSLSSFWSQLTETVGGKSVYQIQTYLAGQEHSFCNLSRMSAINSETTNNNK